MKSLSSIGLALSVIFTCLLLALVFEIYYLLWWKRRFIRRKFTIEEDHHTKLSYMLCSKNQATSAVNISTNTLANPTPTPTLLHQQEHKPFEGQNGNFTSGPPQRFLSTIKEETMDDIAESSEDGNIIITRESKSSRKSLSDLMKNNIDDSCQSNSSISESLNGFNPFNECSSDAEFRRVFKSSLSLSSPPPKFKFLRNAEEKLARKTMLLIEQVKEESTNEEGVNGSFTTIIVAKNKEKCEELNQNYHSSLYHSSSCTSSSSSTR